MKERRQVAMQNDRFRYREQRLIPLLGVRAFRHRVSDRHSEVSSSGSYRFVRELACITVFHETTSRSLSWNIAPSGQPGPCKGNAQYANGLMRHPHRFDTLLLGAHPLRGITCDDLAW